MKSLERRKTHAYKLGSISAWSRNISGYYSDVSIPAYASGKYITLYKRAVHKIASLKAGVHEQLEVTNNGPTDYSSLGSL